MPSNYGIVADTNIVAPITMQSTFKGVGAWHTLTDEERAAHGWYPCEIINEGYDLLTQTRTDLPELSFDESKKLITAKFTITDKLVATIKQEFQDKLSEIRYNKEVGGVLVGEIFQSSSRTKRLELSDKVRFMSDPANTTTMWKAESGWVEMTLEDLKSLQDAVSSHVDRCFKAEHECSKAINSLTKAKLVVLNIEALFEEEFGKL